MAHSLSDFKSKLKGGGARPNLFEVEFTNGTNATAVGAAGGQTGGIPAGITALDADTFKYLCKAANLPASNVASIDVPFRGRIFKVAGDRTVDTWTVTVINDENFGLNQRCLVLRNFLVLIIDIGISKISPLLSLYISFSSVKYGCSGAAS